jgi:PAS domain-containing protein
MGESQPRSRKSAKPGLRALEACGDGFWEFDLLDSSAWFSDWFYRKLGWASETKRTTLLDLQPALEPAGWMQLMREFRAHLEQGLPLDLRLRVRIAGDCIEWWHMRGSAQRNAAGQPIHLAGSMREAGPDMLPSDGATALMCLRGAFDALPVAAALLDAQGARVQMNRLWNELSRVDTAQAMMRLQHLGPQSAIEVNWEADGDGARRLRMRAIPFEHEGSRHLAVTLEDQP